MKKHDLNKIILSICILTLVLSIGCEAVNPPKNNIENGNLPFESDDDSNFDEPWNESNSFPQIQILSPITGSFVADSSTQVTGLVFGSNVDHILVNGISVPVSNSAFSTNVPSNAENIVTTIFASAIDTNGAFGGDEITFLNGTSLPEETSISKAFAASITQGGFLSFSKAIEKLLSNLDLTEWFESHNPIYHGDGISLYIDEARIGSMTLLVFPEKDGLGLRSLATAICFGASIHFDAGGNPLGFSINIEKLGSIMSMTIKLINEDATVNVSYAETTIEGLHSELDILPDILNNILSVILQNALENIINEALKEILPKAIEELLESFTIHIDLGNLSLSGAFSSFECDIAAVNMVLESNAEGKRVSDIPWPTASLYTSGELPNFDGIISKTGEAYDFALSISDDILNRFLLAIADAGLLEFQFTLDSGTLGAILPTFAKLDPNLSVKLSAYTYAPPVISISEKNSFELIVPDYRIDLDLLPPGKDSWPALKFSVYSEFGLDFDVTENGDLLISLKDNDLKIHILDDPIQESGGYLDLAQNIINTYLSPLLSQLLSSIPLPMPKFPGMTIDPLYIGPDGPAEDFLSLYFQMKF